MGLGRFGFQGLALGSLHLAGMDGTKPLGFTFADFYSADKGDDRTKPSS